MRLESETSAVFTGLATDPSSSMVEMCPDKGDTSEKA